MSGLVAIAASCGLSVPSPAREKFAFDARLDTTEGWAKYNEHYWLDGGFEDFVHFFFRQMFHEPHSTKQVEDFTTWASDISAQTPADTTAGRLGLRGAEATPLEPLCERVRCPVVVIHGSEDRIRPARSRSSARRPDGRRARAPRGCRPRAAGARAGAHQPPDQGLRRQGAPALERPHPGCEPHAVASARSTCPPPIGLGHARRDLAIARELRARHPDLRVDWLAQDPVTRVLASAGETVHPASRWLASESAHFEDECGEHDLHAFRAIRRMDEIPVNNFMLFTEVVADTHYDTVIGDEARDVDHFLHENPELKRFGFAG
ncbi:hypothetical protein LP418_12360 [Nocardioides sp. B-3]|nr:hypothetical protein [Nocardioides sp. B-3]UUZ61305.1 hypothetical protein LP418_12360 [Nocardioides sp. B-3]